MKVTIEHAQEAKEQDIFFPGNVVIGGSDCKIYVLITQGTAFSKNHFCGVVLDHWDKVMLNRFDGDWCKSAFKQFHGKIILEK